MASIDKSDFRTAFCGLMMGAADIVPGVSGGTVALVLGIYNRLVSAISHFDQQALRMLAASAWLRAREAKEGAEDPAMLASCRQWLGSDSFLHAGAWRLAFEEARNEFDTR